MKTSGRRLPSGILLLSLLVILSTAFARASDIVQERADQVAKMFCAKPDGFDAVFGPTFLKAVPTEKLKGIFLDVYQRAGTCRSVEITERISSRAAKVNFVFNGFLVAGTLSVDSSDRHLIEGLFIQPAVPIANDFNKIVDSFKKMPDRCGLLVVKLADGGNQTLASITNHRQSRWYEEGP